MKLTVKKFHNFLKQRGLLSCPVCFFKIWQPSEKYICMTCGATSRLYYCISCGYVGCDEHRNNHYQRLKHRFFMDMKGFNVSDCLRHRFLHCPSAGGSQMDLFSLPMRYFSKCFCFACLHQTVPRLLSPFHCMDCKVTDSHVLYICTTCGYVGCGKNPNSHTTQHYATIGHADFAPMQVLPTSGVDPNHERIRPSPPEDLNWNILDEKNIKVCIRSPLLTARVCPYEQYFSNLDVQETESERNLTEENQESNVAATDSEETFPSTPNNSTEHNIFSTIRHYQGSIIFLMHAILIFYIFITSYSSKND